MSVRMALVGAGKFGERHLATLSRLSDALRCDFVGVVDNSTSQLEKVRSKYPNCRFEDSLDNMLPDVDAVDIVTPPPTHYTIAMKCLKAGKDVMIEKPMATSFEQALKIHQEARSRGKQVGVGHLYRHDPLTKETRAMISRGDLGEIWSVEGEFLNPIEPRTDIGAVMNYPHFIDLSNLLLEARPNEISCLVHTPVGSHFEDKATLVMGYGHDVQVALVVGWAGRKKKRCLTIEGSLATVTLDFLGRTLEVITGNPTDGLKHQVSKSELTMETQPLYAELRDFVESLGSGHNLVSDSYSGLLTLYLSERALESAKDKRVVDCTSHDGIFADALLARNSMADR